MEGDLPNEVVPKYEVLGYGLYGILEPEHVTETEPGHFTVTGNGNVGADVVNIVAK